MQTCLKTGSASQQTRLIAKIVENVQVLISDQFANYVVSEVIHFGERTINVQIAKVVCADLGNYCCSKFSSSVVESLMKHSGNDVKEMIFEVFMSRENFQSKKRNLFKDLMINQFGNYAVYTIIQQAVSFPNKKYIKHFLYIFRENSDQLRRINFGKKFMAKIDALMQAESKQLSQQSEEKKKPGGQGLGGYYDY